MIEYIVEDRVLDDIRIADDFYPIKDNQCRGCKKEITPYTEQYIYWDSDMFKAVYKYGCGYCKECASKHEGAHKSLPAVTEKRNTLWGTATFYADGSLEYTDPDNENWMY